MFTSTLYRRSPAFLQSIAINIRSAIRTSLRERNDFQRFLSEVQSHDYSKTLTESYKAKIFHKTLHEAIKNVTYYRELDIARHFTADTPLKKLINLFPVINKKIVISNHDKFINHNIKGLRFYGATSGTSGTPLIIPQTLHSITRENAFIWRQLHWAGFKKGDKRAWIRGDMVVPSNRKGPPFWVVNLPENMLMMSSFHLTPSHAPLYVQKLEEFKPKLIQAYPSSIIYLAQYLKDKNLYYRGDCRSILTSSETLFPEDRKLIEERFGSHVFDYYGLFERNVAIHSCEYSNYHLIDDYSYVEFDPQKDGSYSLIGTAFNNPLFPLIRYHTGDAIDLPSIRSDCPCGRHYPLIRGIYGRIGDYIKGEYGQKIFILNHIPKGIEGIIETQFIQNDAKHVDILVVAGNRFTHTSEEMLINKLRLTAGEGMSVAVHKVDAIARTKNGKFQQAICSLK